MSLVSALMERRQAILDRWGETALASYPANGASFFAGEKDRFRNPVGTTILSGITVVLDGLLGAAPRQAQLDALDDIVRLRSVQQLTPSAALGFVLALKRIIRRELAAANEAGGAEELVELEARIDELALRAFDGFVACRERVYEIRAREAQARVFSLLRQANLVVEDAGCEAMREGAEGGVAGAKGGRQA